MIKIMQGKLLRQALDKFMQGEVAQNARVQVVLPNGEFYDVKGIQLLENKLMKIVARFEEKYANNMLESY